MRQKITVETFVHGPIEKIWNVFTQPEHIKHWYFASPDWHVPSATNDLKVGGIFTTRMEAKNGSTGFDFGGTYTKIEPHKSYTYTINGDGRVVEVDFVPEEDGYKIVETFEVEDVNSVELQQSGWQAILDNYKKYLVSLS